MIDILLQKRSTSIILTGRQGQQGMRSVQVTTRMAKGHRNIEFTAVGPNRHGTSEMQEDTRTNRAKAE